MSLQSLRKAMASASAAVLLWSSAVVPGLGTFVAQADTTGSDHYAFQHCQLLEDEGVVKSGTCSKLNDPITKGEFVKVILYVAAIGENADATSTATDVSDDFVRDAVNTAYEEGILSGEGGDATKSGAGNQLNRAVAATIGGRAYTVVDEFPADGSLSDLVDGQWYSEYARKAVSAGVIVGKVKNGVRTFAAADTLTYGEAMALAFQFARAEIAYDEWTSAGNSGVPSTSAITALDALDVYNFDVTYNFTNGGNTDGGSTDGGNVPPITGPESLSLTTVDTSSVGNIPIGANNVLFAAYDVSGNANITQVEILREGPGEETDIRNVYLYFGDQLLASANNQLAYAGEGIQLAAMQSPYRVERRTTGKSINSEDQKVVFFVNLSVRGNGRLEIRGDMSLTAAASSQHAFRVTKINSTGQTYDYPTTTTQYRGPFMTLSGSTVGTINIRTNASVNDVYVGQKDAVITRFEAQLNSLEGAKLERLTIQFRGGVSATDMSNYKLFIVGQSEPIATSPVAGFNDLVTFIVCATKVDGLCQPFAINKGDTRVFYVTADLNGAQTGETIDANFDETTDLVFIGTTLGAGLNVNLNTTQPGNTEFKTSTTVLGADLAISFIGPAAGETSAGLNSAVLAKWNMTNNSGGRLQARDWQVRVFSTVASNLNSNAITNARLVVQDEDGRETSSLFSSIDLGPSFTPAAANVSGLTGFQITLNFLGSYDIPAGSDIDVAFVANLETSIVASNLLITLVDLSQSGRIRDDNNDDLTSNEIKPASDIAAAVQSVLSTAVQLATSPLLGNPALALGEKNVDLMATNFRAGSGTDVNFSQIQYSVIGGPDLVTPQHTVTALSPLGSNGLQFLRANAQATFLNIRLEVVEDGKRKVVSDIETIDINGKILFDNLENKFTVKNGSAVDLFLVADINTSGKESNKNGLGATVTPNVPYQFQIDPSVGSATNKDGRNISTANLFPTAVTGQLVTVSTGGNIILSDQSQTRTQYVAQTTANSVVVIALVFKLESKDATSELDDMDIAVVTGTPSVDTVVVTGVPGTGTQLSIAEVLAPGNVNGVTAFGAGYTCVVGFFTTGALPAGGVDTNCGANDSANVLAGGLGTANVASIDITVNNTPALVAAQLRLLKTDGRYLVSGSGIGAVFTRSEPLIDGNISFTGSAIGNFGITIETVGVRDGRASQLFALVQGQLPTAGQTLVIADSGSANPICTITFSAVTTGGGAASEDELDCSNPAFAAGPPVVTPTATIDLNDENAVGDPARTGAQLAAALSTVFALAGYDIFDITATQVGLPTNSGLISVVSDYPLTGRVLALGGTAAAAPGAPVNVRLIAYTPGTSTIPSTASSMLAAGDLYADGQMVKPATTISTDRIQYRDLNTSLLNDQPIVFAAYVRPKRVATGEATAGQTFRLMLQRNVFRTVNNGSILSKSGQELNPLTVALNNGNQFVIQRATISFESGGAIDSDLLSASRLQFLKFKMPKSGTGTVEIGDGVANTQIQFEINKTAAIGVSSCDIQDSQNTIVASSSAFSTDAFGAGAVTNLATISSGFVTFTPANFVGGKRLEGGSTVYTLFCTITGTVSTSNSVQASLTSNVRLAVSDNGTSLMNNTSKFLGLPVTGTPRIAP